MKKIFTLCAFALLLTGCSSTPAEITVTPTSNEENNSMVETTTESMQNFSDEMKIPHTVDLHELGADSVERMGDHENSPYFTSLDYYNMESDGSLAILSKFKTQQQTSDWSCGLSAVLMVLEYYGVAGDHNEETLAQMRHNKMNEEATLLVDIVAIFEALGFEVDSTYDHGEEVYEYMTLDKIRETVENGLPIVIAWCDWGGHWQVIIGYDTMGTDDYYGDDVIIVADSYDTTDHNQDGYGIYPAERFWGNFTMFDFLEENFDACEERDFLFAIPKLVE